MLANDEDPAEAGITQDKLLLHPNDPHNFLKLCTMVHILLYHQFTDSNVDHVE